EAHEALALTFVAEGRADSAEAQERIALREFRRGSAPGHTRIWSAARNLGIIVEARGRVEEGLAYMDTSIAIARTGSDGEHYVGYLMAQTVPFLIQLGRVAVALVRVGRAEDAQPLLAAPCSRYMSHGLPNPLIVKWAESARAQIQQEA